MGDVRMVAAETLVFVEHAQEDVEDRVTCVVGASFAVDVEQNDIGAVGYRLVDVGADHGVAHFVLVEEGNGALAVASGIMGFDVGQQVRQRFQEVRLT